MKKILIFALRAYCFVILTCAFVLCFGAAFILVRIDPKTPVVPIVPKLPEVPSQPRFYQNVVDKGYQN